MAREIVKNLKFKKYEGKFDRKEFAKMLDDAYLATKRADGDMTKYTFSPSSFGYGHGNCPRYWYMAFSGANFVDNNDAQAVANMANGTLAHERIQNLIHKMGGPIKSVETEIEIKNEYPPIRGFIDLLINWDDENVKPTVCDSGPTVGFHLVISGLESRQQHNQANGSVLIIWSFWPVVVYNLDNSTYGSIVKSYFRQDIDI